MSVSTAKQAVPMTVSTRFRPSYAYVVPIALNSVFAAVLITITDILSPIYPCVLETWYSDQYIFELTGKMWAEGGVPYVDFWDQKGPLIFLFNMLGWKLTGSSLGIFLLTVVWTAVTVNMLYLLAREFAPQRHGTTHGCGDSLDFRGMDRHSLRSFLGSDRAPLSAVPRRFPVDCRTLVQTVRQ